MGFLSKISAVITGSDAERRPANPEDDFWWEGDVPVGGSAIHVNATSVLSLPEVYGCLKILSETIGALPIKIFEKQADGSKKEAKNHPLSALLSRQPNVLNTAFELRSQLIWDLSFHRNAFAEIIPDGYNPLGQLYRLAPEKVSMVTLSDGSVQYEVSQHNGTVKRYDPEHIFHIRSTPLTDDNFMGRSLIKDSWQTFGHALAVRDYGRRFFENDATPGGMLTTPEFKDNEEKKSYVRKWQRFFSGKGRHRIVVLDGGMEFTQVNVPNNEAQFIETKQNLALDILRLWRMPPHKVGMLEKATNNNIEHQSLEFVMDTVIPLAVAFEQAISRCLLLEPEKYFAEHNMAGLLRGDLKSRYEAYSMGKLGGWLSSNDIRKFENMNPIKGGDSYLEPMNMDRMGEPKKDAPKKAGVPGNQGRNGGRLT